jgi:hypothetical protein
MMGTIRHEGPTMSPTYFAVHMARLDARIEAACKAGDILLLQKLAGEQASLLRSMYGHPLA